MTQLSQATEPFEFRSRLNSTLLTGQKARDLAELVEHLRTMPGAVIYHPEGAQVVAEVRERAGARLGTVSFTDTAGGLLITPRLSGRPPGQHGFHIHEKGDCGPGMNQGKPAAGFAAGGHYDPGHTKKHLGPFSTAGHRGDLPVLVVDNRGDATQPVTAPHLTVAEIRGRSVMVHAGGDNYSDTPLPLGGGGARIACGVIR